MKENINFEIPNKVLALISSGEAIRYGGIIRNTSGKILYHLRESSNLTNNVSIINSILPHTGEAVRLFSNITPGLNLATTAYKVFQEHKTHKMLGEIKNQLNGMEKVLKSTQIFSAVGMASSLITLGVVVASFYVLNKKLNNITSVLNGINDNLIKLNQKVDDIDSFLKESVFVELKSSTQLLDHALLLSNKNDIKNQLLDIKKNFNQCKFKFEYIIGKTNPNRFEIYDKFYKGLALSIIGEIQASLYLNEFDLTKEIIKDNSKMLYDLKENFLVNDVKNHHLNLLEKKAGGKEILIARDKFEEQKNFIEKSVETESLILKEIFERIDSFKYEVETIEKKKILYKDWKNLSNSRNDDDGILFIKAF